jgi:CRP-like cAMP-binding protein
MEQNLVLPTVYRLPLQTPSIETRLRAGEVLVSAGSAFRGCIRVKSGKLKRIRHYEKGAFLHGIAGAGEELGWDDALGDGQRSHRETLEAIGETIVTITAVAEVDSWLQSVPERIVQILRGSVLELRRERYLARPMELLPVRARVAATLWLLALKHGRKAEMAKLPSEDGLRVLDLNLTREEVAHLAGTVYESVIRTLTSLKKEGVVDLNGRVIRILNEDQLARIGQIVISERHDENTVA